MSDSSGLSVEQLNLKLRLSKIRKKVWSISVLTLSISLLGLILSFLNPKIGSPLLPGLDFTGGTQIQVERACSLNCSPIDSSKISLALNNLAFPGNNDVNDFPSLNSTRIQLADNYRSVVLRLPFLNASQSKIVINTVLPIIGEIDKGATSVNTIGPTLGGQLLKSSLISLLVSFAGIASYISFRYDRRYAILALIALGHDIFIVCGIFAWLGLLKSVEVDSLFAVSLLTIAGYSVNDTVVIFDRIRENSRMKTLNSFSFEEKIDFAVSSSLGRTIFTSSTTLLPLLALILFGGSTLYWFAISLAIGVVVGSWSSIALAPSLLSLLEEKASFN